MIPHEPVPFPESVPDGLDREHALDLMRIMLRIRRFEEKCAELYTREKIRGFLHLGIGEEAIPAGTFGYLRDDDEIVATYREHGHAIARGIPMSSLMSIGPVAAAESGAARQLFQENCAVCHGADRGGYIAPGLNSKWLPTFTPGKLESKIITGGLETLMPPHPTFFDKLSRDDIKSLALFIKTTPGEDLDWSLNDIKRSLEVLIDDESTLPDSPVYAIDHIDDLMAVMARGRYATGYVSAGYTGDELVVYDAESFQPVKSFSMEVPAGIFSRSRARTPVVGQQEAPR